MPQSNLPDHEIETLARYLLPSMLAFFESKEGQAEFKAWQEQQKTAADK